MTSKHSKRRQLPRDLGAAGPARRPLTAPELAQVTGGDASSKDHLDHPFIRR